MKLPRIAILIPCFNEAISIQKVIADFRRNLPHALIYVYDNNSIDGTSDVANKAGAIVRSEHRQGKGFVVCRMFSDIEADVYLLVDGDGTYNADDAPFFVHNLIHNQLDFLNIRRVESHTANYRPGHRFGNFLLTKLVSTLFSTHIEDMLSGYKFFSRRYVKSFPSLSTGFEIETQLVVHAMQMGMPISELPSKYSNRQEGDVSKLSTYKDGFKILFTIFKLLVIERPIHLFGTVSLLLFLISLWYSIPVVNFFIVYGTVPKFPTWISVVGLFLLSFLVLFTGIFLNYFNLIRKEIKRLFYLSIPITVVDYSPQDL